MTTKHSHGPNFGRRVDDCLRCQELKEGAEPVRWNVGRDSGGYPTRSEVSRHFAPGGPHERGVCGPVCTFGDY